MTISLSVSSHTSLPSLLTHVLSTYDTSSVFESFNLTLISSFFSSSEGLDQNCLRNQSLSQSWRKTRRRTRRKGWSCPRCHCYCLQTRMKSWRSRCCLRKSRWKSSTNHCCWSWRRTSKKTACEHISSM